MKSESKQALYLTSKALLKMDDDEMASYGKMVYQGNETVLVYRTLMGAEDLLVFKIHGKEAVLEQIMMGV